MGILCWTRKFNLVHLGSVAEEPILQRRTQEAGIMNTKVIGDYTGKGRGRNWEEQRERIASCH